MASQFVYTCNYCRFRTDRLSKLNRHNNTKKHHQNIDSLSFHHDVDDHGDNDMCASEDDHDHLFDIRVDDDACENNQPPVHGHAAASPDDCDMSCSEPDVWDNFSDVGTDTDSVGESQGTDDQTYFPFPNKTIFLLCTLMHSSTHDLSDRTMQYILYILRELGVFNVPSLKYLKNFRFMDWENMVNEKTDHRGVPFFSIKVSSWLCQSLAHPTTADALLRYPRKNQKGISSQADGLHWQSNIPSLWAHQDGIHYHSGQFVKCGDMIGRVEKFYEEIDVMGERRMTVILEKFLFVRTQNKQSLVWVPDATIHVHLSECEPFPYSASGIIYKKTPDGTLSLLTEEEKLKIQLSCPSEPSVSMPINLFMDDTSANKSRRWHPIHTLQAQLSGLPLSQRDRVETVSLLSASGEVGMLSMACAILHEIEELKRNPVISFDAKSHKLTRIVPDVGCLCLDGAMLSEVTHHLGASANRLCAVCKVHVDNCLDVGCAKTASWLKAVLTHLNAANSANQKKRIQSEKGVKLPEGNVTLLDYLDVFRCVTFGSLHWYYLGIVRSTIKEITGRLSAEETSSMCAFLNTVDQSSFQHHVSSQTVQYFQSRQGKDFKVLVQLMPFVGYYLDIQPVYLNCLINLAKIARFVESKNMTTSDIEEFQSLITCHLGVVKNDLPGLQRKQKTHSSLHVISDVRKHGPMQAYKEDNFEKRHGDIRRKLFHQNQHSRSRDTAVSFAADMCLQHIITGGFFLFNDVWVQAGCGVRHPGKQTLQFVGGRSDENNFTCVSETTLRNQEKDEAYFDSSVLLQSFIDWNFEIYLGCPLVKSLQRFSSIKCKSTEMANRGNFILYQDAETRDSIGKVVGGIRVIEGNERRTEWVEIVKCEIQQPSVELHCPVLKLSSKAYVPCQSIKQVVCIIHNCRDGKCTLQHGKLVHSTYPIYFLNTFRLSHPAGLLTG